VGYFAHVQEQHEEERQELERQGLHLVNLFMHCNQHADQRLLDILFQLLGGHSELEVVEVVEHILLHQVVKLLHQLQLLQNLLLQVREARDALHQLLQQELERQGLRL
jgi:hypothetical protein